MAALLEFLNEDYISENELESSTVTTYKIAIASFERWFKLNNGSDVEWHKISHKVLNSYFVELGNDRSSNTVRSHKSSLMAILNTARRRNMCSFDLDRIRRIKRKPTPKDFWNLEEVTRLAETADSLCGRFRATQIKKDFFARAYVMTVWDTALRRGDMAMLRVGVVTSSLEFSHPRVKTGVTDICRISPQTYQRIQLTFDEYNNNRKLLFPPWQGGKDPLRSVSELFQKLMLMAGLQASDSCLKKLVRSSIMEADALAPGTGWLQGHHSGPNTTFQAYANRQRANLNRPTNRPL